MQVSDLYVLDLYDFYVYMACLNLCPVWFNFPPYSLLQNSSFAIIIINEGVLRTSDGGNGNHSVSLPIILIKIKVDQKLPSSYVSSLLVSIL